MNIESWLSTEIAELLKELYGYAEAPVLQKTKKEFEGDYTLVCFGLSRASGKAPKDTATEIGTALRQKLEEVNSFNVVNGFLNISLKLDVWISALSKSAELSEGAGNSEKVMVEYSSPNTNKPLHLGHIRNNLLGNSIARILEASGRSVVKVNLVNDRGIHICKSMLAWQMSGTHETPESSGIKGDHLVGKYYVEFDKILREQATPLMKDTLEGKLGQFDESVRSKVLEIKAKADSTADEGKKKEILAELKRIVNNQTSVMKQAQQMLRKWEEGDPEVKELWKTMNGWVYDGFNETYKRLGVSFDKFYYESETYLLGKDIIREGLEKGVLYQKGDGSIWIDLTDEGLDHKVLLRSDGTSVYMTQDIGTAVLRNRELNCKRYIYVVGNEQDYHFKALALILKKLGYSWAEGIYHLSYGMVDLPEGKMKSREGTVVDADDLMDEVIGEARQVSEELGKTGEMTQEEKDKLYETLGMGALKYYILKVDPKKRMVFNPAESIDIKGNTGPFIQYSYARIQSLRQKTHGVVDTSFQPEGLPEEPRHRNLMKMIYAYGETVEQAAEAMSPALIANYAYDLAKEFNQFYHDFPIMKEENGNLASFRLALAIQTGEVLKKAMSLLGIEMPARM